MSLGEIIILAMLLFIVGVGVGMLGLMNIYNAYWKYRYQDVSKRYDNAIEDYLYLTDLKVIEFEKAKIIRERESDKNEKAE